MNIKALVNCNTDIQNIFDELNNESNICKYEILKHTNLSISEDMLIIIFEILKNLEYNAIYDLLKLALLEIISKINTLKKHNFMFKTTTSMIVIVNEKRTEVNLPFELSEEQKNKVVDAAINKLFD